jgi:hypothetical protein
MPPWRQSARTVRPRHRRRTRRHTMSQGRRAAIPAAAASTTITCPSTARKRAFGMQATTDAVRATGSRRPALACSTIPQQQRPPRQRPQRQVRPTPAASRKHAPSHRSSEQQARRPPARISSAGSGSATERPDDQPESSSNSNIRVSHSLAHVTGVAPHTRHSAAAGVSGVSGKREKARAAPSSGSSNAEVPARSACLRAPNQRRALRNASPASGTSHCRAATNGQRTPNQARIATRLHVPNAGQPRRQRRAGRNRPTPDAGFPANTRPSSPNKRQARGDPRPWQLEQNQQQRTGTRSHGVAVSTVSLTSARRQGGYGFAFENARFRRPDVGYASHVRRDPSSKRSAVLSDSSRTALAHAMAQVNTGWSWASRARVDLAFALPARRRASAARGPARPGQDHPGARARRHAWALGFAAHAVHCRSAALGHPRRLDLRAGPAHTFRFHPGPVFTQLLLADEINRAPPRTQSALARGDGRAPGHHRRRLPRPADTRSSSSRRRIPSIWPAPSRCRIRSSTVSCCALSLGYPDATVRTRDAARAPTAAT